jgi:hypothetical protein
VIAGMRLFVIALVLGTAGIAAAYPQYQLSRDQTCTGCHLSPAGGNLLSENGLAVAESTSQFGHKPEFMYGKLGTPSWLQLGGEFRVAGGWLKYGGPEDTAVYGFPMQGEIESAMLFGSVSLHITAGIRPPQDGNEGATYFWSREHYAMWKQHPDDSAGAYVRLGRFLPVFGLRFAEHPQYTRRFGGTALFTDAYAVAYEQVAPTYELHLTAFTEDPLIDPVEHASGAALYGEFRPSETLSFGAGVMYKNFGNGDPLFSSDRTTEFEEYRFAVTNKVYLSSLELLLSTELQFINGLVSEVDRSDDSRTGGAPKGIVGNLIASRMFGDALLLDVGLGHYDSNFRIANLDRNCVDLNLHWFTTSHVELVLNTRYEVLAFGKGGDPGAYTLLQIHYRL